MTAQPRLADTPLIPETAPFSPEQRAWLNGFFAGLFSLDGAPAALSPAEGAALMPAAAADPLADGDNGEARPGTTRPCPWTSAWRSLTGAPCAGA